MTFFILIPFLLSITENLKILSLGRNNIKSLTGLVSDTKIFCFSAHVHRKEIVYACS